MFVNYSSSQLLNNVELLNLSQHLINFN